MGKANLFLYQSHIILNQIRTHKIERIQVTIQLPLDLSRLLGLKLTQIKSLQHYYTINTFLVIHTSKTTFSIEY